MTLYPASGTEFFLLESTAPDVHVTFVKDETDKVTGFVFRQKGEEQTATRIETPWFLLFIALGVTMAVTVVLWLIWKAGSVVWLSRFERAVCAAAAGCLALAAAWEGNLLQGRLLALPIVVLLVLPRRRAVRLTAAVTGFALIFVLAAMPAVLGAIIGYFDLLLSFTIAAICGLWNGLNLTLLANPPRRLWRYVVGGLAVVPALALVQPFVSAVFLHPIQRASQGQYPWALLSAAEFAVVFAGSWWLAVRLTGAREPRLGWRGALGQLGYWIFFLACLAFWAAIRLAVRSC